MRVLPLRSEDLSPAADDAAVAAFVQSHQRPVFRFLRALGCAPQLAEELTQDALLIALEKGVARADAAAFLRQAAKFAWLRRQRDDRRRAERLLLAAETLWQRDCAHDDGNGWLDALRQCLSALPARSRHVLQRAYGDDAGRAELAAELGIGEHGVRTLLQRLRQALKDCVLRRRQP